MNLDMLKPMFQPMLKMLRKTAKENGIKFMVLSFDDKEELQHAFYNEDVVIMKRSEFNEMINDLTNKKEQL